MKYIDHHVHTAYSPDSEASVTAYLRRAKALGLAAVMFTDHADFGNPDLLFQNHINYKEYFQTMNRLQDEYEIQIRIGVEIGYDLNYRVEIADFLERHPFDFVIASIHSIDNQCVYTADYFEGKTQTAGYNRYFEALLEMVENFSNFDVIGHLDYITRYGPSEQRDYDYEDFQVIIDSILRKVIAKHKGLEVNTSGLRGNLKATYPKEVVLKNYKELGGKILTVGSDCHTNQNYLANVPETLAALQSLGFEEITSFLQRSPQRRIL